MGGKLNLVFGPPKKGKSALTYLPNTQLFESEGVMYPAGIVRSTDMFLSLHLKYNELFCDDSTKRQLVEGLLKRNPAVPLSQQYAKDHVVQVSDSISLKSKVIIPKFNVLEGFAGEFSTVSDTAIFVSQPKEQEIYVQEQGGFVGFGVADSKLGKDVFKSTPVYEDVSRQGKLSDPQVALAFHMLLQQAPNFNNALKTRMHLYRTGKDSTGRSVCDPVTQYKQAFVLNLAEFYAPDIVVEDFVTKGNTITVNREAYTAILIATTTTAALAEKNAEDINMDIRGWPMKCALNKADQLLPPEQNFLDITYQELARVNPGVLGWPTYQDFGGRSKIAREGAINHFGSRYLTELVPALMDMNAPAGILDEVVGYCKSKLEVAYKAMEPAFKAKGLTPVDLTPAEFVITSTFTSGRPTYNALRFFTG